MLLSWRRRSLLLLELEQDLLEEVTGPVVLQTCEESVHTRVEVFTCCS